MSLTIETPAHHAVRGYLVETLQVSLPPGEGEQNRWVIRSMTGMSPCVMRRRAFSGRRRAPVCSSR